MAEFMHRRGEVIVPELCLRVVVRIAEPYVATGRSIGRVIGIGGRIGGGRLGDRDIGAVRFRELNGYVGIA
jgi:hypothetical protein